MAWQRNSTMQAPRTCNKSVTLAPYTSAVTNATTVNSADRAAKTLSSEFATPAMIRHRRWRNLQDFLTKYLMAFGGFSVIVAITLIAFYLLYVVVPLFYGAKMQKLNDYRAPAGGRSLMYAMEEQREIGLRVTDAGNAVFFRVASGAEVNTVCLAGDLEAEVTAFARGEADGGVFALGFSNGQVKLARQKYEVTYPDDTRLITPLLEYPLGEKPLTLADVADAIVRLAIAAGDDGATLVGLTNSGRLLVQKILREENLMTGEVSLERTESEIPSSNLDITHMVIDKRQRWLFVADGRGLIHIYDIGRANEPQLIDTQRVVPTGEAITGLGLLSGGFSLIIGDSSGRVAQWFPVRDENNNYTLARIRTFPAMPGTVTTVSSEYHRKGFLVGDSEGNVGIYHATANQRVALNEIGDTPVRQLSITPRANGMLVELEDAPLQFWDVVNDHPEVSFSSLWGKVWYEGRDQPEYIWQSSSASSDFEPKFSLTPLAFGTLKAAFYAMLFSIPLAILGAIYTAYFMSPRMRELVKPTIEIMEALPTVILGFLAGLWLAPFVEKHLPGIFMLIIFIPVSMLAAAWLWHCLPERFRHVMPDGWEALLLAPVLVIAAWLAIALSAPIEVWLFDGNMPQWLSNEIGIPYNQRNSLVVGLAMGFAVIPTIFSISEDAIHSVPRHLTTGSLALGATPWQTMVRVVLLTASPGIFSAVMIGFGRAVGETMIVVMATGNTAIMDLNIFEGFRALSANIAVEMPETAVNSTHYRILFLAALVLFIATFMVNTIAEIVRQRLRTKYSSL